MNDQFSYVTYLYDDIQWTLNIRRVGFFTKISALFKLLGSGDTVRNLVTTSNVGMNGIWMYRVDGVIVPGTP